MKLAEFLKQLKNDHTTNYVVVCPDLLGLRQYLPKVLASGASEEDIHVVDAKTLNADGVRMLEAEANRAPRGSSNKNHFFIFSGHVMSGSLAAPLLKVMEEAKRARFIVQLQEETRATRALCSRLTKVSLAFMTRDAVVGNLQRKNVDVAAVDRFGLYDGTLEGTEQAIGMRDAVVSARREMKRGARGLAVALNGEVVNSLAFTRAWGDKMTEDEKRFLDRRDTEDRRRIVVLQVLARAS